MDYQARQVEPVGEEEGQNIASPEKITRPKRIVIASLEKIEDNIFCAALLRKVPKRFLRCTFYRRSHGSPTGSKKCAKMLFSEKSPKGF
jgi:hypothetical protein